MELLSKLAELGGEKVDANNDVIFRGKQIILPETLSYETAIEFLDGKRRDEEQVVEVHHKCKYRPFDGAMALKRVFETIGGMWTQKPIDMGIFGIDPPHLVSVPVSATKSEQVPWGAIQVPFMPGVVFYTQEVRDPDLGPLFQITVECPKKYRKQVEGIFKMIDLDLGANSIYRGKAIDGATQPQFLALSGVDPSKVTYSDEVLAQLEANVWTTFRHTDVLRQLKMAIKRAVLLHGTYGTGKTLAAYLTAIEAVKAGWTFVYVRPDQDLIQCMQTARLYSPACVFFEDLDAIQVQTNGDRDKTSIILDAFDGLAVKGVDVLVLLTTNHPEDITPAMLRPGRVDSVIEIGPLDRQGLERLVRSHIDPDVLEAEVNWDAVEEAFEGFVPAFVVEALGRSRRYVVARTGQAPTRITTEDLVHAAGGLRPQLDLMNRKPGEEPPTVEEILTQHVTHEVQAIVDSSLVYCSDCRAMHPQNQHEMGRPDKKKATSKK